MFIVNYILDLIIDNEPLIAKFIPLDNYLKLNPTIILSGILESVIRSIGFEANVDSIIASSSKYSQKIIYIVKLFKASH